MSIGWLLVILLVVYYSVRMWTRPGNFEIFYLTGTRFALGSAIYQPDWDPYVYAPFFAIVLNWFASLSVNTARIVWMFMQIGVTIGACVVVKKAVISEAREQIPRLTWWVVFALSFQALELNLLHLQVNALVFLATFGGLLLIFRRDIVRGAVCLSFAVTLKLTPALFLPYLAVRRQWRALAATLAGIIGWLTLPVLWVGWTKNLSLIWAWRLSVGRLERNGEYLNDSLAGVLYRLFTNTPCTRDGQYCNWVSLDTEVVTWVYRLVAIAGIAGILVWIWRRQSRGTGELMTEWSLLFIAALIFSPTSWKHHYVPLVLVYALLAVTILQRWAASKSLTMTTVAGFLLVTGSSVTVWGSSAVHAGHVYGLPVMGLAVLGCAVLLSARDRIER